MHPEHVQMSGSMGLQGERKIKHQEVLEEEIDVLEVDNGGVNGDSIEDHKGNGLPHKENGHSYPNDKDKIEESGEDKMAADANSQNGSETKPVLRLKTPRRNSTSSCSSSVSSALSVKQQTPMALQMEVSLDEEEREHLEPLIIGGTAEDLEVSLSVSHDDGDEEATTDTETVKYDVMEIANDPYEFDEETGSDRDSEVVINKKSSSAKPSKAAKQSSKAKDDTKPGKPKASRKKSLKLKETSSMPCEFDSNLEETDAENSDTYSISKEDTEFEDSSVKLLKSPKRSKPSSTKLYLIDEAETEEKNSEPELAPRRSSRSRQTPQKYNSSVYVDSFWDHPAQSEDRMNNSDAALGGSIRSVKGRRSLRKSRNMSSLNTSLHNESSPWENELKVLTPSGGCLSIHRVEEVVDSSTPSKRKAVHDDEDDVDNLVERGQKKMCIENIDLDTSTSSQTSSFFSIITSPITLLKNRLRGSSVSCSTPVSKGSHFISVEPGAPCNNSNNADDNSSNEVAVETEAKAAPEAQKWCSIM